MSKQSKDEEMKELEIKLKNRLVERQEKIQALSLEERIEIEKKLLDRALEAWKKAFDYISSNPNTSTYSVIKKVENLYKKFKKMKDIQEADWDFFWIQLLKVSNIIGDSKINFDIYNCYHYGSEIFGSYDEELDFIFYEIYTFHKKEETERGNGCRSEKQIFKNAVEIVKKYIPTFTNGVFNKRVSNKYIDLLGVCSKTGKYIIVEFKKEAKDATHQLYSYDRLLGGGNILVSLTEKDVPVKHKDIIYLTLEK